MWRRRLYLTVHCLYRVRGITYLSLHCHHQGDSFIHMGSGESHFNVPLIVRDKVTRQCPQTTIFEENGEPKWYRTDRGPSAYQPTALPLGQTVSHTQHGPIIHSMDLLLYTYRSTGESLWQLWVQLYFCMHASA